MAEDREKVEIPDVIGLWYTDGQGHAFPLDIDDPPEIEQPGVRDTHIAIVLLNLALDRLEKSLEH